MHIIRSTYYRTLYIYYYRHVIHCYTYPTCAHFQQTTVGSQPDDWMQSANWSAYDPITVENMADDVVVTALVPFLPYTQYVLLCFACFTYAILLLAQERLKGQVFANIFSSKFLFFSDQTRVPMDNLLIMNFVNWC